MTGLSRKDVLSSVGYPTEELELERWGGTVTVRGLPLGHDQLNAYMAAPMSFPTELEIAGAPRLGHGASAAEKTAARVASAIATAAATVDWRKPDMEELIKRQTVGAVVLGVLEPDGSQMFTWEDVDYIRRELDWSDTLKCASKILELSQGPDRDPDDEDEDEKPEVTAEEEPDEGKDSSAITPG